MKTPLYVLIFCVVAVASEASEGDDKSTALRDFALQPPRVTAEFDPHCEEFARRAGRSGGKQKGKQLIV